jgi:hypothetical protein
MARSSKQNFTSDEVEALYDGRSRTRTIHPQMDSGENVKLPTGWIEDAYNHHDNQFAVDDHGAGYSNDVLGGWVAGSNGPVSCYNETAENKPDFDASPPRSKMRR